MEAITVFLALLGLLGILSFLAFLLRRVACWVNVFGLVLEEFLVLLIELEVIFLERGDLHSQLRLCLVTLLHLLFQLLLQGPDLLCFKPELLLQFCYPLFKGDAPTSGNPV